MGDISRLLAEQRVKEYDLRLRHVDELLDYAGKELAQNKDAETKALLDNVKNDRDKLAAWLEGSRRAPLQSWREDEIRKAGPMAIWDAVAQQLERLVERLER